MTDLKPYYDKVLSAQANLQATINLVDEAMALGTPEGDAQALALEPKLDEANANVESALSFYAKIQKVSKTSDTAKNFVPVSATEPGDGDKPEAGKMKRKEFVALDTHARAAFVHAHGVIED